MIDDKQVRRYIDALKAPAKAFEYCHPTTTAELVSLLEELLERRGAEQQESALLHEIRESHSTMQDDRGASPCQCQYCAPVNQSGVQ